MYRRLLVLLVAFVVAWFFGPALTSLLETTVNQVSVGEKTRTSLSNYFLKRDEEFYIGLIFWTVVLFFLLPLIARLFNFVNPHARRYGTTKPIRRIHGFTTELLAVTTLFILATVIFGLIVNTKVKELVRYIEAHSSLSVKTANDVLRNSVASRKEWESVSNSTVTAMFQSKVELTNYLNGLKSEGIVTPPDVFSLFGMAAHYDKLARAIELHNETRRQQPSIPPPTTYLRIFSDMTNAIVKHSAALEKWNERNAELGPAKAEIDSLMDAAAQEYAAASTRDKYLVIPLRHIWFRALFVACLLWFVAHVFFKSEISSIHRVILRFLEEGRFGQGGSGRFAGMFEEWGILSRYTEPGAILSMVLSLFGKQHIGQRFGEWVAKKRRDETTISSQELFMGRSLYNPFLNIGLSDDRHMLTIAPSRTGKGATVIIPNLLLWEGSAIVIDPKGTNAAVTAKRRRAMGQKVHLVDPFGIVAKEESERACFNPLEYLDPDSDTIREDIAVLADALVVPDPETKEKHWDDGARTVLGGLIGELITAYENPQLPMLRDLLALDQDQQNELWARMYLNPGAGDAPRDAASRIIRGAGTNEISGLISNADKHTEWLSSPTMRRTFARSTFRFADLKEQPTTIYLILPPKLLATHNRFLRLFINMAILQMSVGGRSKIPVLMVLDEFLALGHMAEVEKALGLMAGYNFVLWPIVQDLARLKDLYKNSVHSFIANSRAVQVFGVTDPTTTEYISKQIGNTVPSILAANRFNSSVPLRSPDEVAKDIERESNRQYILRAGKAPLVLEKVPYFDGALFGGAYPGLFHGKYDPDPDHAK